MTRCSRWSWTATTSTCSPMPAPAGPAWSTSGAAMTTERSDWRTDGRWPDLADGPPEPGATRADTPNSATAWDDRWNRRGEDFAVTNPSPAADSLDAPALDPIRVLIVDDHALFRRGLQMVLEQEPDIEVVGEAGDGAEAVGKAADALPDIVLMDVRMPRRGGIDACMAIKDAGERQQVASPRLTDREMDVLKLVAKGLNNRDIAKALFISENTVKNHIRNILEKLQLHSRMEAVVYAVREKLLEIT